MDNDKGGLKRQWGGRIFPMGRTESSAQSYPFNVQEEVAQGTDCQIAGWWPTVSGLEGKGLQNQRQGDVRSGM